MWEWFSTEQIIKFIDYAKSSYTWLIRKDGSPYSAHPLAVWKNLAWKDIFGWIADTLEELDIEDFCRRLKLQTTDTIFRILLGIGHDIMEDWKDPKEIAYNKIRIITNEKLADTISRVTSDKNAIDYYGKTLYFINKYEKESSLVLEAKLKDLKNNTWDVKSKFLSGNIKLHNWAKKYARHAYKFIKWLYTRSSNLREWHKKIIAQIYQNIAFVLNNSYYS